jgi:hypothetical protein
MYIYEEVMHICTNIVQLQSLETLNTCMICCNLTLECQNQTLYPLTALLVLSHILPKILSYKGFQLREFRVQWYTKSRYILHTPLREWIRPCKGRSTCDDILPTFIYQCNTTFFHLPNWIYACKDLHVTKLLIQGWHLHLLSWLNPHLQWFVALRLPDWIRSCKALTFSRVHVLGTMIFPFTYWMEAVSPNTIFFSVEKV